MSSNPKDKPKAGGKGVKPKAADCAQVTKHNVMMINQPSKGWGLSRLIARAKQKP